ncbi:MAG: mannonate dehydratase [Rhizobiales bacterium]|nr:mannonate dehydratase [Hyphomicrobiales bacterium]MBN9010807.1 mannonate dehydratase [Hyphomicrobiales bacterium]
MLEAWRWFGPGDPVTLDHARHAGAKGIVTALHHQYDGRTWTSNDILAHRKLVEDAGLVWSVCESIPMNDSLKLRTGNWRRYLDNWKDTLANLGRAGVPVVCYNFMPILDWMRTDLMYRVESGGYAVRFDRIAFAAFDLLVLKRSGAERDYSPEVIRLAEAKLKAMTPDELAKLEANIIGVFPAREEVYSRDGVLKRIAQFAELDVAALRGHLVDFLREVLPVAADVGVRLGIHADDPPYPLFGLPRIVSTADDLRAILAAFDVPENGLTFCVGSLGVRPDNDLVAMVREFAPRIHFAHLRNVKREPHGSFFEADHLDGDSDMVAIVDALLGEERARRKAGRRDHQIPMRPDHGHLLVDDIGKVVNPGYSCIGRLKGLAELRGVMRALDFKAGLGPGNRPVTG